MKRNSNIERQMYADATKQEKASHNGVDTSRWGNDCPRIKVPEGWQDHQYTQQLIRKYLNNDFVCYNIASREAIFFVTEEEIHLCQSAISDVAPNQQVKLYQYVNMTSLGWCLDIQIRDNDDKSEVSDDGRIDRCDGRVNGSFIGRVYFLKCDAERKKVILGYKKEKQVTVDKSVVENVFLHSKSGEVGGLTDYGWIYWLKRKGKI